MKAIVLSETVTAREKEHGYVLLFAQGEVSEGTYFPPKEFWLTRKDIVTLFKEFPVVETPF